MSLASIVGGVAAGAGEFEAFGPEDFVREFGLPSPQARSFDVLNSGIEYELRLFNGGLDGELEITRRVEVTLNGVVVIAGDEVQPIGPQIIVKTVSLELANSLEVMMAGPVGGGVAIVIAGEDDDPPSITAAVSPEPNAAGWNNSPVTVTFDCSDATSGIASCSEPVLLAEDGAGQAVTGTAVDHAGNSASATVSVHLDQTPPTILPMASPGHNGAGWNNTPVTVSFACGDATSGVASCTAPMVVSTDGAGQSVDGSAVDLAGNTASAKLSVNLDQAPPSISALATPRPNAAGWNNSPVTVGFDCADDLSGLAACPPPEQLTANGPNQVVSGIAQDLAGNSAGAAVSVSLDQTPPVVLAAAIPGANGAGWNNTPVAVSFDCSDTTSGIAECSEPIAVSADGAGQEFTGTAVDVAGNDASADVSVNVDRTPPTISAEVTPEPDSSGWNTSPVTVEFECMDGLSGVAGCTPSTLLDDDGVNQVVSGSAQDLAGNSAGTEVSIDLDQTAPEAYIGEPTEGEEVPLPLVTVSGYVLDALSGVEAAWLNDEPLALAEGDFSQEVDLGTTGPVTVEVAARDEAGNYSDPAAVDFEVFTPPDPPQVLLEAVNPQPGTIQSRHWTLALRLSFPTGLEGFDVLCDRRPAGLPQPGNTAFAVIDNPVEGLSYQCPFGCPCGLSPPFDETGVQFTLGQPGSAASVPSLVIWSDSGPFVMEEDGEGIIIGLDAASEQPVLNLANASVDDADPLSRLAGGRSVSYELQGPLGPSILFTLAIPPNVVAPVVTYDPCVGDPDDCDGQTHYRVDLGPIQTDGPLDELLPFQNGEILNSKGITLRAVVAKLDPAIGETGIKEFDRDSDGVTDVTDLEAQGYEILSNEVTITLRQYTNQICAMTRSTFWYPTMFVKDLDGNGRGDTWTDFSCSNDTEPGDVVPPPDL